MRAVYPILAVDDVCLDTMEMWEDRLNVKKNCRQFVRYGTIVSLAHFKVLDIL